MDDIGSITFTFINNVCINLSGLYIRMSKHSFNGIDVGITFELQSCEGMTTAVECDMLLDARCFNPFLQWTRNPRRTSKSFKYTLIWFSTFSAKGVSLFINREIIHHVCLSLGEIHSYQ